MATIVDSYSEANQDADANILTVHMSATSKPSARGQSFTGDGQKIGSCKFYMKKVGSPGRMVARLFAHTGTFGGGGTVTGVTLDSSEKYEAANVLGTDYALFEFTGFAGYTLVNGTKYCIVAEAFDGTWDASNYASVGRDTSSPTHGGNMVYFTFSSWKGYAPDDVCFYVYGAVVTAGRSYGLIMG